MDALAEMMEAMEAALAQANPLPSRTPFGAPGPGPPPFLLRPPPTGAFREAGFGAGAGAGGEDEAERVREAARAAALAGALQDGSSMVCSRCGGVVAALRAEAHMRFWCGGGAPHR